MKICTVGSATQDIFILYEGAQTLHLQLQDEMHSFIIFEQGTKIDVPKLHYATGGGATNTAVGFVRLGLEVEAFFKIGKDDPAGVHVLKEMREAGVNIGHIASDYTTHTAMSFIIPSKERDHIVFAYRGANKHMLVEEFPLDLLTACDYLYINPLSEKSRDLLPHLARAAKQLNRSVAVNPGLGQLAHQPEEFIKALEYVDILILNAYEARYLMRALFKKEPRSFLKKRPIRGEKPQLLEHFMSSNGTHYTLSDFFNEALKTGPSIIAVTNGIEGVYIATQEKLYFQPSIKTDVVSGLGAGDAFSSAFVGSLALGKDLEAALLHGVINASSVIHFPDAKQGLLTIEELEARAQTIGRHDILILDRH